MTEKSRFWDGTTVGDAAEAPYDSYTEYAQVQMSLANAWRNTNKGGVFIDDLNGLVVSGIASPVSVATGRALVYGTWYQSDAIVGVAIPTPAVSTRIDRIVLRKTWASQIVRITRIAGVEGGGAPALTQVVGTTWDIPLAQVSITIGGVITVTDERENLSGAVINKVYEIALTGVAATIDIQNIPQIYKSLVLQSIAKSNYAVIQQDYMLCRFNGDAGPNYGGVSSEITGSTNVSGGGLTGINQFPIARIPSSMIGNEANAFGHVSCEFLEYNNPNIYKVARASGYSREAAAAPATTSMVIFQYHGLWLVTSAVNRITLFCTYGSFIAGTKVTLYGLS